MGSFGPRSSASGPGIVHAERGFLPAENLLPARRQAPASVWGPGRRAKGCSGSRSLPTDTPRHSRSDLRCGGRCETEAAQNVPFGAQQTLSGFLRGVTARAALEPDACTRAPARHLLRRQPPHPRHGHSNATRHRSAVGTRRATAGKRSPDVKPRRREGAEHWLRTRQAVVTRGFPFSSRQSLERHRISPVISLFPFLHM